MSASATTSPAVTSGLFSSADQKPIPLDHVRVEAHVVDAAARVTIRQSYRNLETVPLEVVYVFPLDEGAAVCGFEATVDGVRYVGRAMERDEAFKEYDDALEAGHGGFLLDEERADVFTASLGNLKPGSDVELSITYVTELAAEGEAVRFTLPTTVSPRYAPAADQTGVGPDAGRDAESAGGPHGALRLQLRDGRDDGRGDPRRAVAVAPHRTRARRPARDGAPRAAPGGHGPRPGHRRSPPTTCPRRTPSSNARRRAGPWRSRSFRGSSRRPRRPR